jgi:hypothetical protein
VFLLVSLAAIAVALVHLRGEQNRAASRTLAMEVEWMRVRSEWWSLQTRAARLRAPCRIRERVQWLGANLHGPARLVPPHTDARLASDRRP